jgi:hypothetical protein
MGMKDTDIINIGAKAVIVYSHTKTTHDVFISFGEYNEETGLDSFGMFDHHIFFYSNPKEVEEIFCSLEGHDGWEILEYELIYKTRSGILSI